MNWKRLMMAASIVMVALALGCAGAGGYGKLMVEEGGMTVETLVKNWQNYHVYYAGDGKRAVAVLFDPKNDGQALEVGPRWVRMPDEKTLSSMVGTIKQSMGSGGFIPRLRAIVSPDGATYGYAYTGLSRMVITVIDDKTMRVESLT
jgi:hypothetical protein